MRDTLDCLLIFPPFEFPNGFYTKQRALDPPLMLMALAAYIRPHGYSVEIHDTNAEFENADDEFEAYFIKHYKERYKNIRVIGFTTTTPSINATFRLARICKKHMPDAVVILGGAHASFVPDESLDKPYVDVVCLGEGEETLKEVLDGMPYPLIKGLAYKQVNPGGGFDFIRNAPRLRIKELDALPMPAYDLIDMSIYRPIIGNFKRLPAMMVVSSRGCPWSCNFCRRPVGKMWTHRSARSLYNEFKTLSEEYGIKDIAIMDDVFTVNKERVEEFCDLLINEPLDLNWLCFARVDIVNEDMLKKMKKAGCWQIMFGAENFNQKVLNGMDKGLDVDQIFEGIRWAKNAGLEIRICMMVGNVGDTEEIILDNIKVLNKMAPDYISVAILTPFPGHDIYNWAMERDLINTYDWDLYYGSVPILKLDTLTEDDIFRLYRKMTFSFYFRPQYIFKKILKIRGLTEIWINIKGFSGLFRFFMQRIRSGVVKSNGSEPGKLKARLTPEETERLKELTGTATKQTAIT